MAESEFKKWTVMIVFVAACFTAFILWQGKKSADSAAKSVITTNTASVQAVEPALSPLESELKEPDSCGPSIKLPKKEYNYGPPSSPSVDETNEEYQRRLKDIDYYINNSDRLYELAYLAYIHGDLDVAEKYFVLSLDADNYMVPYYRRFIHSYLGEIDERRGNLVDAQEHFKKLNSPYEMHLIQAKIYWKIGEIESAEREYLLAQSVELYEMHNITPYLLLAEMFLDIRDYDKAERYANEYLECAGYVENNPIASRGYGIPVSEIREAESLLIRIKANTQL